MAPIMDNKECRKFDDGLKSYLNVIDEMCADYVSFIKEVGSPLFCKFESGHYSLVGLLSWGRLKPGLPGVYTRVARFIKWIEENAQ